MRNIKLIIKQKISFFYYNVKTKELSMAKIYGISRFVNEKIHQFKEL